MFVTRSIDKFSYRISTQIIIVVVEGQACDENIDYTLKLQEPGRRDRSVQKLNTVCHRVKTLPYSSAEVESRTQGSRSRPRPRTQKNPRPRTAFPRTDTLEA